MRKMLVLCAALLLGAVPVLAQQATPDGGAAPVAEQVVPAPQPEAETQKAPAPSLAVGTDEVRRDVAAAESSRSGKEQVGSQSFWYLVAAIAIGIIIAAVVLD